MSVLRVSCKHCHRVAEIPYPSQPGQPIRCPGCQAILNVPASDSDVTEANVVELAQSSAGGARRGERPHGSESASATQCDDVVLASAPVEDATITGEEANLNGADTPTEAGHPKQEADTSGATVLVGDGGERKPGAAPSDMTAEFASPGTRAASVVPVALPDIPGFQVQAELGRGGMGVVYKAIEIKLNRVVAVKMILAGGHASGPALLRFLGEAKAIAQLRHPNIVQLFEAGQHQGLSYFTLEYVEGGNLARRINGHPMPLRDAVRLLIQLARGIHYAHQCGIVHRDLKPANVLLEGDTPKITDFGLAKRIEGGSDLTASGAIMGTPSYMAPEQAESGKTKRPITTAADIYSLGAILFETMTGRPPFRADSAIDTILQVLSHEPPAPRKFNNRIDRDLETICLKCLEKEPAKRYGSAEALADDLERWVAGETIRARPAGYVERGLKWARRRPAVAGMIAVSVLALAALAGLFVHNHFEIAREQAQTQDALIKKQQAFVAEQKALVKSNETLESLKLEQEKTTDLLKRQERTSYLHAIMLADREIESAYTGRVEELLRSCPEGLRRWEWHRLHHLANSEQFAVKQPGVAALRWSADGRQLHTFAAPGPGESSWQRKSWDVATGSEIPGSQAGFGGRLLNEHADKDFVAAVRRDAFVRMYVSPDSTRLVQQTRVPEFTLRTAEAAALVGFLAGPVLVAPVDLPPMHSLKIAAFGDGAETSLADSASAGPPDFLEWSPDGRRVFGLDHGCVTVWEAASGKSVWRKHDEKREGVLFQGAGDFKRFRWEYRGPDLFYGLNNEYYRISLMRIMWSPDAKRVALVCTASQGGFAQVWDAETGQEIMLIHAAEGYTLTSLAWSPSSQHLAALWRYWLVPAGASVPQTYVKIWQAADGAETARIALGSQQAAVSFAWGRDSARLATAHHESKLGPNHGTQVKIWNTFQAKEVCTLAGETGMIHQLSFSPDGTRLLTAGDARSNRVWNALSGLEISRLEGFGIELSGSPWNKDGQFLLGRCRNGEGVNAEMLLRVWDSSTGKEVFTPKPRETMFDAAEWSPDGQRLATLEDGVARVWEVPRKVQPLLGGVPSPDGRQIAMVENIGRPAIRVRDVSGKELFYAGHGGGAVTDLAWSRDGQRVASASDDRTVKIWDAADGKVVRAYTGHTGAVKFVRWCGNNNERMLSVAAEFPFRGSTEMKLWDPATGADHAVWHGSMGARWQDQLAQLALSDNGLRLATVGYALGRDGRKDATLRVWDTLTAQPVREFPGFQALRVSVNASGDRVAAYGTGPEKGGGRVIVWDTATGKEVCQFALPPIGIPNLALSGDGRLLAIYQNGFLTFWDATRGLRTGVPGPATPIPIALRWSADSTRVLVSVDSSQSPFFVDAVTGGVVPFGSKNAPVNVNAWHPNGRSLAGVKREAFGLNAPYAIQIFDAQTGALRKQCLDKHLGPVHGAYFSPDGTKLATAGTDRTVRICDPATGKLLLKFTGHAGDQPPADPQLTWSNLVLDAVYWSPDGRHVASVGRLHQNDNIRGGATWEYRLHLWEAASGKPLAVLPVGQRYALSWSPGGQHLAVVTSADAKNFKQKVEVWDFAAAKTVQQLEIGNLANVVWSPGGKYLAVATWSAQKGGSEIQCWEIGSARPPWKVLHGGPLAPYSFTTNHLLEQADHLVFRGDERQLAVAGDKSVRIRDAATGHEVTEVGDAAAPLAWSPDGRWLASLNRANTPRVFVQVHDAAGGKQIQERKAPGGATSLLWSPDGKRLFIAQTDFTVAVWDPETAMDYFKLKGIGPRLAWGRDGRTLINLGQQSETRVWRVSAPENSGTPGVLTGRDR
jgi:WD40 repeat protein